MKRWYLTFSLLLMLFGGILLPAHNTYATEQTDSEELYFGNNLILAGEKISGADQSGAPLQINGLLFQFGNQIETHASSEYNFVFGNKIELQGNTKRDTFTLGNSINIKQEAKLGGGFYAAGDSVEIQSDINGDLAIFARQIDIAENVKIDGQINLYADEVNFGKNVSVSGNIIYNEDAKLNGYANISHTGKLESYHQTVYEPDATTILTQKLFSTATLIIVTVIMIYLFPKIYPKIKRIFTNSSEIVKSGVIGFGILIFIPVLSIILLLSVIGAPISVLMLALYFIGIYLSQAFTGIWLGHLITTGLIKAKSNPYIEALVGIIVLAILSLVPYIGYTTGLISLIVGLGLIIYAMRGKQNA